MSGQGKRKGKGKPARPGTGRAGGSQGSGTAQPGTGPATHTGRPPNIQHPTLLFGQTPQSLAGVLVAVLGVVAATLALDWKTLRILCLTLLGCSLLVLAVGLWVRLGRRSLLFAMPFLIACAGLGGGAWWQKGAERPADLTIPVCMRLRDPISGLVSTLGASVRRAPGDPNERYSGPAWEALLGDLKQVQELALTSGDGTLVGATRDWRQNWTTLTGTKIQVTGGPDKDRYLSKGLLAALRATQRCEELGHPVTTAKSTTGRDVCRSLTDLGNLIAARSTSAWPDASGKVVTVALGRGLEDATLKRDAVNFSELVMDGYVSTNGTLNRQAGNAYRSLLIRCDAEGIALPLLWHER